MTNTLVSVIMGSKSDYGCVKHTCDLLQQFGIGYEVKVLSAHRTLEETLSYVKGLKQQGVKLVIAAAGGAAHLPGVIAGATTLPVIGIPIKSSALQGLDSLLSIVQMPSGVPVATVSIGDAGAKNAAILALTILGSFDDTYYAKLQEYKETMRKQVLSVELDHE